MADELIFERWEDVPQGLVLRQVLTGMGLRPPKGANPAAWMVGRRLRYALWAVDTAVAVRKRRGLRIEGE